MSVCNVDSHLNRLKLQLLPQIHAVPIRRFLKNETNLKKGKKREKRKEGGKKHTSRPSQIPRPTGTAINPTRIEILPCEEIPALARIDEGEIGVEDPFPAALNGGSGVRSRGVGRVEDAGPFLGYEGGGAREGGVGEEREHVNSVLGVNGGGCGLWFVRRKGRGGGKGEWEKGLPVDVFPIGAEIGCCVDFVLEELVGREVIRCICTNVLVVVDHVLNGRKKMKLTIPVTLFPTNSAGWLRFPSCIRK